MFLTNKLLTIVIPVYNMEAYLEKTLSSVALPEYEDKVEILVVNDGSSDSSKNIINQYAKKYPRLIRAIHKDNGGWGTCIKLAIKEAQGKYFKVLDSDDWFNTTAFTEFVHLLEEQDVDLILTPYTEINDTGDEKHFSFSKKLINKTWSISQFIKNIKYKNSIFALAAITYRTSILSNENITIGDKYYSDIDYDLQPLAFVKTLHILPCCLYFYYRAREAQSTSTDGYISHIDDYKNLLIREIQFFTDKQKSLDHHLKKHIFNCILRQCKFYYKLCMSRSNKIQTKKLTSFDKYIQKTNLKIYLNLNLSCVKKIIPFIFIWRFFKINIYNF